MGEKMREKDKAILRSLVEEISKIEKVKAIVLFGSLARKEETPRSDIDIMVVFDCDEPYDYLRQVTKAVGRVIVKSDRDINPLLTNLRDYPEDFIDDLIREGFLLYGNLQWKGRRLKVLNFLS
jgi:predicted nucleotidyltransferase